MHSVDFITDRWILDGKMDRLAYIIDRLVTLIRKKMR